MQKRLVSCFLWLVCLLAGVAPVWADAPERPTDRVVMAPGVGRIEPGRTVYAYEDRDGRLSIDALLDNPGVVAFEHLDREVPNFGFSDSVYWLRLTLDVPADAASDWFMQIGYAPLNFFSAWVVSQGRIVEQHQGGGRLPFHEREVKHRTHVLPLALQPGATNTVYIRVHSETSIIVPITLWRAGAFLEFLDVENLLLGLYFGILLAMAVYNGFIYATVREPSYLWYVLFILTFGTMQLGISGLAQQHIWPELSWGHRLLPVAGLLAALLAVQFTESFLGWTPAARIKPKQIFLVVGVLGIAITLFGSYRLGMHITLPISMIVSVYAIAAGFRSLHSGYQPARFYLFAWAFLFAGVITYALRMYGLLPSTLLTDYSIQIGSAAEMLLLSLALGDRMRLVKDEREALREELVERLRTESIRLEEDVRERTRELVNAQRELVMRERMASVGTLSAGVAHEVNNPNNFVLVGTQNASRWREEFADFLRDLVDEDTDVEVAREFEKRFRALDEQLAVISEGGRRIKAIVSGLQAVTHLNEEGRVEADVVAGLESALQLIEPRLKEGVDIRLQVRDRPRMVCWAAELNQAFLSIFMNALQAIADRRHVEGDAWRGELTLSAALDDNQLQIVIADNGVGMTPSTAEKVFDPFFTTRGVGEGSGLGLTICRDIIQKHGGRVELVSRYGRGTRVEVLLPIKAV
jgi:signal transduction histidine kinase